MNMEYSSPNSSTTSISSDSDITETWRGGVPGCARCGNIIYEKTLLCILDKVWHPSCLKCSVCNKQLNNDCYTNGGNILCYDDYIRTCSFKCSGCKMVLSDKEYVRKVHANVYHQNCFRCACCERHLETGEKFYLREDDKLVCADDYETMKTNESYTNDGSDSECSTGSGKRYRTNLTPQQLNCLQEAFDKNPKPSRDTRRRLSRDLRLDYRVIQVWFQNKRAKCKKSPKFEQRFQNGASTRITENNFLNGNEGRFSAPPVYHENLYRPATRGTTHGDWLTTALAHDSIPPNVDLSPVHIVNGEINRTVLQNFRSQTPEVRERTSSADDSSPWHRIL